MTPEKQRHLIAHAAARLIAEDGITDYTQAKRKAAQGLGLPDNTKLPDNAEVEDELRLYQRHFQNEAQRERIAFLRQKAAAIMARLQAFTPYLTGSVLEGTATRHAEIDIQLFPDSAKDVEIFLLNQGVDFEHSEPRTDRAEAVLTLLDHDVTINLVIYPRNEERVTSRTRDGRIRQRIRLDALSRLLATNPDDHAD